MVAAIYRALHEVLMAVLASQKTCQVARDRDAGHMTSDIFLEIKKPEEQGTQPQCVLQEMTLWSLIAEAVWNLYDQPIG